MHFTEDQGNENESETQLVEDDCVKCTRLRKMLEESLQLPLVQIICISCLVYGAYFSHFSKVYFQLKIFIDLLAPKKDDLDLLIPVRSVFFFPK